MFEHVRGKNEIVLPAGDHPEIRSFGQELLSRGLPRIELERIALFYRVFPNRFAREVDVVNPSGVPVHRDDASPRKEGTTALNFNANPIPDHFPAFAKRSCVRRMDSARGSPQHATYTAGLENTHEAFDNQTATPAVECFANGCCAELRKSQKLMSAKGKKITHIPSYLCKYGFVALAIK